MTNPLNNSNFVPAAVDPTAAGGLGAIGPIRGSDPNGDGAYSIYTQYDQAAPKQKVEVTLLSWPQAGGQSSFTASGNGTTITAGNGIKYWSLQVKGTGAAASAWSVVLEGRNGLSTFTTLLTHGTADGDGTTKFLTTPAYVQDVRARCVSVTLGGASNIVADWDGCA